MSAPSPELLPDAPSLLRAADRAPQLVLLPVPPCEPPYDDELPGGAPRLSLVPSAPAPVGPLAALPALRLAAAPAVLPTSPPAAPPAPAVRPVARALAQGLLEVLGGVRPVTQLRRRTSVELYADLEELVHARPRPQGARPSTGAVLSLHVQRPSPAVAEVCATVRQGSRAAALALRLELEAGGWCCTAVDGLGPCLPRPRPDDDGEPDD